MREPSIIPRKAVRRSLRLLVLFLLIAAAINVPWALTFMRSRETISSVPTGRVEPGQMPARWPSKTPHRLPWPAPEDWSEGGAFGCRVFDVRTTRADDGRNGFSMHVQQVGWPLPVIEETRMWWDWDDPALAGPEPDPALALMSRGLLLNPILLGGGAWLVLVAPWLAALIAARRWRQTRGRCMQCGYPVGSSAACSECGAAVCPAPA